MADEPVLQQLLRLNHEAATLAERVQTSVLKMEAARAEGDEKAASMYRDIYDNQVAQERCLNARQAALEARLAGRLHTP